MEEVQIKFHKNKYRMSNNTNNLILVGLKKIPFHKMLIVRGGESIRLIFLGAFFWFFVEFSAQF